MGLLPSSILHPLSTLRHWAGFVKFSHTIFALPFALAAVAVAARADHGWPGWRLFALIVIDFVGRLKRGASVEGEERREHGHHDDCPDRVHGNVHGLPALQVRE